MLAVLLVGALVLGLIAARIGLPPLVGFLASGFVFGAFGMDGTPLLEDLAHGGVLLLLFAVGLKLRIKTLLRFEVWGTATSHLLLTGIVGAGVAFVVSGLPVGMSFALAVALGFSSTVLAAKVLEGNRELRAVHGRVAIGILIVQDVVAVALLSALNAHTPSPFALLLLLLPFARPVISWLLERAGHGELLVLFGAVLAIGGGAGFEALGVSAELGALLLGTLLADHKRSQELSTVLWGLKELFLVGFFLKIGFSGQPTWEAVQGAVWLVLLLPLKGVLFFLLLIGLGLRARTSFLTAVSLVTYSEFALIVVDVAVNDGLLGPEWLVVTALAVAFSFVAAAPLNTYAHDLFRTLSPWLERLERDKRHPDDEPISLGAAEILIVGMGRVGSGAYDYLREQHEKHIVGIDSDPAKIESNVREGRRVAYADAEDPAFWHLLNVDRLRAIMLAVPDLQAKISAARALRKRGYRGLLSATHLYPEEQEPILEAGCDVTYNYYTEAGVGFARHTYDTLRAPQQGDAAQRKTG
ncbi:MAG TPA: cation:proton antiporter family protein [Gammaproteobacteria bacterium]|nr:cation:proton antiporter family protein [Gammaproteobacteria bacterium]